MTPYVATQPGTITSWKAEFSGGNLTTGVGVPAGVQLKVLRRDPTNQNLVRVVSAGAVHDPRPALQLRFGSAYPFFLTADSVLEFSDPNLTVLAGDIIGVTITSDPAVGGYFYPLINSTRTPSTPCPAGVGGGSGISCLVSQDVQVGGTIDLVSQFVGSLNQAPALQINTAPTAGAVLSGVAQCDVPGSAPVLATVPVGAPAVVVPTPAVVVPTPTPAPIPPSASTTVRTALPGATVELLSGSAVVAATTAGPDGSYTFTGLAPNGQFTVRYTALVNGKKISCSATVVVGEGGLAVQPAPTIKDNNNHKWTTALALTPGQPFHDYVFQEGQSDWYMVPVRQGQRVSVRLTGLPADYSLALYKDIQKEKDALTAATLQDVQALTASVAPDAVAPDAVAPDAVAPDAVAPDAVAPDAVAPDAVAPDAVAPDAVAPDAVAPDAVAPEVYSSAQTRSLIAISAHPGLSPETIDRRTWDNFGNFYIRVKGHNGAFNAAVPFTLQVDVVDSGCSAPPLAVPPAPPLASFVPTFPDGRPSVTPQAIFLTNTGRLRNRDGTRLTPAQAQVFMDTLRAFAGRREIGGVVVDLDRDPALRDGAYAQWDRASSCAPAANVVADTIHQIIDAYRTASDPTALRYVVLVGGDNAIPYRRVPDGAGLGNESTYVPPVLDASESQASLRQGYVLSQDFYASFSKISRFDHDLFLPEVAIGRLVEDTQDITTMLDAYVAVNGVSQPTDGLVTGYDFLSDAASAIGADLSASVPAHATGVDTSLIQPSGKGPLDPTAWTADQLRGKLFGAARYGVLSLNGHFSANSLVAANITSKVRSDEIASVTDQRFRNTLVLSTGCHSGYDIVNGDAIPGLTQLPSFPQAFARQGATLIGGTGYQYGDTEFIKYSEQVLTATMHQLRFGSGGVPVGRALAEAKRLYVHAQAPLSGTDEKALAEATLFGLPMWSVDLPTGRLAPTGAGTQPITPAPGRLADRTQIAFADVTPSFTLARTDLTLPVQGGGSTTVSYLDASTSTVQHDVLTVPGQPILPRVVIDTAARGTLARGAVLLSATYTDLHPFHPLTDVAATEARGIHPAYATSVFSPSHVFTLNDVVDQTLVLTPFQFVSDDSSVIGTGRRYDSIKTRVYYSPLTGPTALAAAPVVYNTSLTQAGSKVHVDVTVGGLAAADVEDVFATFTATDRVSNTLHGRWTSVSLTPVPDSTVTRGAGFVRHYAADIETNLTGASPTDVRLFVQAVGGTGLVTTVTNNGVYYRVEPQTASAAAPKGTTSLVFTQPGSYSATYRSKLHVEAQLTAPDGAGIAGQPIAFKLGPALVLSTSTDSVGKATADLPVRVLPDAVPYSVTAAFAETDALLGSGDSRPVVVTAAPTTFEPVPPARVEYSDQAVVARLLTQSRPLNEAVVLLDLPNGQTRATLTDGFGQVALDTLADGLPPGPLTLRFPGELRYQPARGAAVVAPEKATLTFRSGPQPAGPVTLSALVTQEADSSPGDLTRAQVNYSLVSHTGTTASATASVAADGTSTVTLPLTPGVYTVKGTVGGFFTSPTLAGLLPVFDPNVAIEGEGRFTVAPTAVGLPAGQRGRFDAKLQYPAGTRLPSGEFKFEVGGDDSGTSRRLEFEARAFEWLVVSGSHVVFQGTGTVDDGGRFHFRVIADALSSGGPFEIRIWSDADPAKSFESPSFAASGSLDEGRIVIRPRDR